MKKKLVKIISIIIILISCLSINYVKADSGWDYDYDSGTSWDSGSSWDNDWDSGSSWDNDWDSGSSYGSSSYNDNGGTTLIFILFLVFLIIISIKVSKKTNSKYSKVNYELYRNKAHIYKDKSTEEIEYALGMTPQEFKELAFNIYKEIQNAWSNFDYETLRKYTTDELFNTYKMQLETLELKKHKNIMKDIVCNEVKVFHIKENYGILNVTVYINISMYDYVVNSSGEVYRGTDKRKANIEYEINFIKNNNKITNNCPNCGAEEKDIVNGVCTYCRSEIVKNSNDFVMSKKRCINQRME